MPGGYDEQDHALAGEQDRAHVFVRKIAWRSIS